MISGVSPDRLVPSTSAPMPEQPAGRVVEARLRGGDQRRIAASRRRIQVGAVVEQETGPVADRVADCDDQAGVALPSLVSTIVGWLGSSSVALAPSRSCTAWTN